MHTCPRRAEDGTDRADSPLVGSGPNRDEWREDRPERPGRACSYCGSMHPDDFMAAIRAGKVIGPTDKGYKFYVTEPLTDEQRAEDRQRWIGHYVALGLSEEQATAQVDANPIPGQGAQLGKFYTPHLSEAQGDEFDELWRVGSITWGYPGRPYVPLFIPGQPKE